MKNPLASETSTNIGLLVARVPLGLFFVIQGYRKITDSSGIDSFVSRYLHLVPRCMPAWFGTTYLHILPFAELLVGLMIVLGFVSRVGALLAGLMLVSFMIAVTGATDKTTILHFNLIFAGIAFGLFFCGGGRYSLDRVVWGSAPAAAPRY